MQMKNEKIARLIAEAYNAGKEDGYDLGYTNGAAGGKYEGHTQGYDEGYAAGYAQALRDAKVEEDQDGPDFEITLEDEEDDGECQCPSCADPIAYDMGWNDGFVGETGLDEDMLKNAAYLAGYGCGAADRKDPEREIN
jgi:hypothetical protein